VFAEEEARVLVAEARTRSELDAMVERRTAGEPLEHVVGWADFCGLRIAMDPGIFVPRRRSEHLVHQAVTLVASRSATGRPPEARDHEARSALDGGPDGLAVVRQVIAIAPRWLAPDGHLLVETSKHQAPEATGAAARAGLVPRVVTSDALAATALIATRPTAA
jgi:methylase of polypeptide subunit release factors